MFLYFTWLLGYAHIYMSVMKRMIGATMGVKIEVNASACKIENVRL